MKGLEITLLDPADRYCRLNTFRVLLCVVGLEQLDLVLCARVGHGNILKCEETQAGGQAG